MQQPVRREVLCGNLEAAADLAASAFEPLKIQRPGRLPACDALMRSTSGPVWPPAAISRMASLLATSVMAWLHQENGAVGSGKEG
ncbi:hypothetical protein [Bradyrhizobium sp. USDA 4502]